MRTFKTPYTPDANVRALAQEVEKAANRADPFIEMQVLHAEPPKVRAGMYVTADGVDWQPDGVNGEGLYRRNLANNAWVFLG